jgi:hypothetical protein
MVNENLLLMFSFVVMWVLGAWSGYHMCQSKYMVVSKPTNNKPNLPCEHRHHYHDMGSIICIDCDSVLPL